jgi:Tfp pilus assembly protein PilF
MKIRIFLSIVMIASLFVAVQTIAQTGAAKGKGRIRGEVGDEQNHPIEGVTVKFSSDRLETSFEIKTNAKGEWVVNGITGGTWNIDFIKEGYETKSISYPIQQMGYNKPVVLQLKKLEMAPPGAAPSGGKEAEADPSRQLIMEGSELADKKDYAGAIAKYEQAMQLKPELYALNGEIGNLYMQMGDKNKALDSYDKFLEKEPDNTDARLAAVGILFDKKDIDGAKKMLAPMDLNKVSNPNALYNVGVGFYNAQDTNEAVKYWEKCVELDPKMTDAYFQLGTAYLSLKNNAKSEEMFKKVIELDPDSENAKLAKDMLDTMQK